MRLILYLLIFAFSFAGNVWADEKTATVYTKSVQKRPAVTDEKTEACMTSDCDEYPWGGELHRYTKDKNKIRGIEAQVGNVVNPGAVAPAKGDGQEQ